MSDDENVQVKHLVPEHVRDAAQDETKHGELSELVRGLYQRVAFGEEVEERESLKKELERTRDKKDDIRAEIRELQAELQSIETKETRLEEKLSEFVEDEQKYIGHLESLESQLYEGANVDSGHGGVERAANTGKCDPEDVIGDLKERNPEIPDYAFEKALHSDEEWNGIEGRILE